MISDTLSDAAYDIRRYLADMPNVYPAGDPLTARILALLDEMESIGRALNSPPDSYVYSQVRSQVRDQIRDPLAGWNHVDNSTPGGNPASR